MTKIKMGIPDNTSYVIRGHVIEGLLAQRLDETRITEIKSLQGVVVYTTRGVFYSEISMVGDTKPLNKNELNETTQGLVEAVTKEEAGKGKREFTIRRSEAYYLSQPKTPAS